jgi:hypothetical protein
MKKLVLGLCFTLFASSLFAADSWVQLPTDAGNTGKKTATVQKTDGSDTVVVSRHILEDATTLNQAVVTAAGALKVDGSAAAASADGTATGSLTNGSNVAIPLAGYYSATAEITGAYTVATFTPQVMSGSTWVNTQFYNPTTQSYAATVSANGTYVIANVGGMAQARVLCSAMSTGSATVNLRATTAQANSLVAIGATTTANSQPVNIASDQTVPVSLASVPTHAVSQSGVFTVQPGNTPNTSPWLTRPSDGVSNASIKAASIAAVAADPALVVAISPNNVINAQTTTPAQLAAGLYATNSANNEQRTVEIPSQLLVDGFDTALDTTVRWNTPTTSGTATAAVSGGSFVLAAGTTTGYAYTTSKASFQDVTPGQLRFAYNVQLEATPYTASVYRFWGAGTVQAAPTTAGCPACTNTMVDAIGFEVNTDQKMYAVTYKSGVRAQIADLSAGQPSDAATHNYSTYWRAVKSHWYIDSQEVPVATGNFVQSGLNKDSLPAAYLVVQGATTATSLTSNTMSVSDTAKNNQGLSDGIYGFMKASVIANDTTVSLNALETSPAKSVATPTATTATRAEKLQVSSTNGGVFVNLVGGAGVLPVSVQAANTLARLNGLETFPGQAASAVAAGTAGRATPLLTDTVTGFGLFTLGDATTFTKAGVQGVDTTTVASGLLVQPGRAVAAPTAVTAGRSEMVLMDVPTGAVYTAPVATTTATGFSNVVVSANTATAIKASAGNVYGISASSSAATPCYVQFYNSNAPTCGTSVITSIALPPTPGVVNIAADLPLMNFATGIGVCFSTTQTGSVTCTGTLSATIFYK